ncbi:glycoside hydrolase family 18 protein [Zasmidium cellare ATCC 36951]|uniref:chitinase n=1 Tax=Zasmidium cellare ATCC 36951 TaxID=1080233 RepID=A0A6A6CN08_ZASCE|nr:glycoside hydrolase family 18 protein [Zasmidium cellare ATCC 36951]KAF2168013.1 glycoside hydrolase family 18 protein [Zasmidium cellare ATCC 36951]
MNPFIVALTFVVGSYASTAHFRLPAAPGYRDRDVCPARCITSGPSPGNWSLYHNFEQIESCGQTIFYDFTLVDDVDDPDSLHRIYACTSTGQDWENVAPNTTAAAPPVSTKTANYQIGYWPNELGASVAIDARTVVSQMRQYLKNGFGRGRPNAPTILLAGAGTGSVGLYIGQGLQIENIESTALKDLEDVLIASSLNSTTSLAMQYCQNSTVGNSTTGHSTAGSLTADHIFGLIATGNSTFSTVQNTLWSWANATCLDLPEVSYNYSAPIIFTTPTYGSTNGTGNSTSTSNSTSSSLGAGLSPRAQCSTVQVVSGDSCASLTQKCGISGADFTKYNPGSNFCSTLQPYQHVCCSAGTLPDFAPQPNSDGSCATYTIVANDNCDNLAAEYSLTVDDINTFNQDTWAWGGCAELYVGTIICLSKGSPPMPAALSNAVCGPQKPGTPKAAAGTDISTLNPCPLNACCDVWGQCGTTATFCTNTSTGAPGTAKPGTDGCISNCGTTIVRGNAPSEYRSIGFFEGFNLDRPCLYQDVLQIDSSKYTHLMFAFGTLDTNYTVDLGDQLSQYEFKEFAGASGPKKILSIGGWAFSTDPSTYSIFRNGVTAANRQTMANSIASFVTSNNLDGINIDWEYPGAPDIPGIPPGSPDDGPNYLAFLKALRTLLPNQEISIAAPASYWYLKAFPIKEMSEVLDYIIYMTYDLHGQWDSGNQWSQDGCPTGTCLRSDVNLTETIGSLVMVTKAGVDSGKVVVGVTSYGRSFAMASANCYGPECTFLGSASDSQATPGVCTQTAGYIANAEINNIISNSSRVNQNFVDSTSNSNILVYDNTQWVGYMDDSIKASRANLYKGLNMGGTTDWATDLQTYNDPPSSLSTWQNFFSDVKNDVDPYSGPRTGNWTSIQCTADVVHHIGDYTPAVRWSEMDCPDAWSNVIAAWNTIWKPKGWTFSESVMTIIDQRQDVDCGIIGFESNCFPTVLCYTDVDVGACAYELFNGFVFIIYSDYVTALTSAAATAIDPSLDTFETTFAPVPPPKSDLWLQIIIALATLGASMVAAPFFNSIFKALPYFKANPNTLGVAKDTTSALITFSSNIAKDVITPTSQGSWSIQDQDNFNSYLGQVIAGWGNISSTTLMNLFDGSADSITTLTTLTQNGQLIEGSDGSPQIGSTSKSSDTASALAASVATAFWAFAIPAVWYAAGTSAFVIDSGYSCGTVNPLGAYMSTATMEATAGCYNGELYYLVYPKGPASSCPSSKREVGPPPTCQLSQFQPPPGLSALDGSAWGGVSISDLITVSVRTYIANGNSNTGQYADPTNSDTLSDLINQDITTPGYITLPVCTADVAFTAWSTPSQVNTSDPAYPCVALQGLTECRSYTFTDATSDASPLVSDCKDIITNIQGTTGEWTTDITDDRKIVSAGACNMDVKANNEKGDVSFHVGAQDVINIINQAISQFSSNGKVGASGTMTCDGNVNSNQGVTWGLY